MKLYFTYDEEIGVFVCKVYRKSYRGTNFSEFARIIQEEYGVQILHRGISAYHTHGFGGISFSQRVYRDVPEYISSCIKHILLSLVVRAYIAGSALPYEHGLRNSAHFGTSS